MEVTKVETYGDKFGPRGNAMARIRVKLDISEREANWAKELIRIMPENKAFLKELEATNMEYGAYDGEFYLTYSPRLDPSYDDNRIISYEEMLAYAEKVYALFLSYKPWSAILARRERRDTEKRIDINIRSYENNTVESRIYHSFKEFGSDMDGGFRTTIKNEFNEFIKMTDYEYMETINAMVKCEFREALLYETVKKIHELVCVGNARTDWCDTEVNVQVNGVKWKYNVTTLEDATNMLGHIKAVGVKNFLVDKKLSDFKTDEDVKAEKDKMTEKEKAEMADIRKREKKDKKKQDQDWFALNLRLHDLQKQIKPNP